MLTCRPAAIAFDDDEFNENVVQRSIHHQNGVLHSIAIHCLLAPLELFLLFKEMLVLLQISRRSDISIKLADLEPILGANHTGAKRGFNRNT